MKIIIALLLLTFFSDKIVALDSHASFLRNISAIDSMKPDSVSLAKLEDLTIKNKLSPEELLLVNSRIVKKANELQQFSKSIKMAPEGIELAKTNHLDSLEGLFNILAGITNYYLERKKESVPYFEEAIRIAQKNNFWTMEARACHNAAGALTDLGKFKPAEEYLTRSLNIRMVHGQEQSHENLIGMRVLATLYDRTDRSDKADEIYKKLIDLGRQSTDTMLLASDLIFYSGKLKKKGKLKEAIAMSEEAVSYLRNRGDFHGLIGAISIHAYNLNDAGRFQEAFQFESEAMVMQRKTFATDLDKQIGEMEVKYKTAEKENQIKLQTAEIDKQKTRTVFLIVSFFLALVTGVLLFNRYRLKAKQQAQEEKIRQERLRNQSIIRSQEDERNRVSRELHDGLGQMLSAARMNLASIGNNGNSPPEFRKALEMIDDSCVEVRNISHALLPALLVKSGLISAVEELAFKTNAAGKLNIFVDYDDPARRNPAEAEINLFRIIQELLNNIIKYSGATEVHIQFTSEGNQLSIMVEDNGKGFDVNLLQQSKGNGWNNIQSRLALIGGTIEIDSQPGNGTVVHIETAPDVNSIPA